MKDVLYQGCAFLGGEWLPWHPISAEVYENRQKWPREGYEVRRTDGVKEDGRG
jgi:hypothetical protein